MRIQRNRLKKIYVFSRTIEKDDEGAVNEQFTAPFSLSAMVWPASNRTQAMIYGEQIKDVLNFKLDSPYKTTDEGYLVGDRVIKEGDRISMSENGRKYKITAIKPYRFLTVEAVKTL